MVEITGAAGPATTHVEIDPESGLTGRNRFWVNTTGLHTVAKGKLRRHRGRLSPAELRMVSQAVGLYLDLD